MTDQQHKAAIAWLESKWTTCQCLVCSHRGFSVLGDLIKLPTPDGYAPMVAVVCDNCANTQLYSAIYMGIVPKETV